MRYYILICNDADTRFLSAPSAFDLACYRLKSGLWGLNERTPHRRRIAVGDKILIYLSGLRENGRSFIASAAVQSSPYRTLSRHLDCPEIRWDKGSRIALPLNKVRIFKTPVHVSKIIGKVEFIPPHRQKMWWHFLRTGCRAIEASDYELILSESGS